ncbi:MAG: hypothetical protein ACYCZ6_12250 [Polaromonas sp.]
MFTFGPGLASMCMAPLGARTAHRMDIIRPLKKVSAAVLYVLAA